MNVFTDEKFPSSKHVFLQEVACLSILLCDSNTTVFTTLLLVTRRQYVCHAGTVLLLSQTNKYLGHEYSK